MAPTIELPSHDPSPTRVVGPTSTSAWHGRAAWLARPWFFAAVALLTLNDHVFKTAWPGLVTGKLSDFAGLVMIATVVSVLLGRPWGIAVSGLAFLALKTIPGVAEAVAPLMGGVPTLRDASDLVALMALPPLWFALGRPSPNQAARNKRGWAAIGLVAAVLATTADSTSKPADVESVRFADGTFIAGVRYPSGTVVPFRSADGGRTWERLASIPPDSAEPAVRPTTEVCAYDHTCYRLHWLETGSYTGDWPYVVQRRADGGDWAVEHRFADEQTAYAIAVDPSDSNHVVVAWGQFAMHRTNTGEWESADLVAAADYSDPEGTTVVADTAGWQLDLWRAMGSPGTPLVVFTVLTILVWRLVPWVAVRVVLTVINVVVGGLLGLAGLLGGTRAAPGYLTVNAWWAGTVLVLVVLMRLSWWADQRSRTREPELPR